MLTQDQLDAMTEELDEVQEFGSRQASTFCHACSIAYVLITPETEEGLRILLNLLARELRLTEELYKNCHLVGKRHALTVLQSTGKAPLL